MDISREPPEQTSTRLLEVMRAAGVRFYDEPFVFVEHRRGSPPPIEEATIAIVRDDEAWSSLRSATPESDGERFALMRFHFRVGLDNSGFIGWLASKLKTRLGTGLFVVCGQNSTRGGIFDYWGCPLELRDEVRQGVTELRSQGTE
jgi:hypothetical protein